MAAEKKHPKVNPVRPRLENSFLTGRAACAGGGFKPPLALIPPLAGRLKSAAFSNPTGIDLPNPLKEGSNGVNLVIGMIANKEKLFEDVKKYLARKFGEIDFESPPIDFDFTAYYEKEMGRNLKRCFLSFKKLVAADKLLGIKLYTNRLEKLLSRDKYIPSRNINLDPGYLTGAKLVLLSTKDFFHRIYLGRGIFAELTLYFKKGSFQSLDWTYPDYRTVEYIEIFNRVRNLYLEKLKARQ